MSELDRYLKAISPDLPLQVGAEGWWTHEAIWVWGKKMQWRTSQYHYKPVYRYKYFL